MPIIVDEVVITVEVTAPAEGATPAAPAAPAQDQQALVAACVERVLEILRERKEP